MGCTGHKQRATESQPVNSAHRQKRLFFRRGTRAPDYQPSLEIVTSPSIEPLPPAPLRSTDIPHSATWTKKGITVAGSNISGTGSNQLNGPLGLFVDDDQTVLIADCLNGHIVEWKCGATSGQVIAGKNRTDRLDSPTDVIVDKERDCLFICDTDNRRVVRWPRRDATSGETIISGVRSEGLTMDDQGFLYISDRDNHDVRRWRVGANCGTVVAGGNGQGDRLDQLNGPTNIFVDRDHSVYVSDYSNHRVMKWVEGAKEGIVVAGGRSKENRLAHLYFPRGVVVDQLGTVYVADYANDRIMRWPKGATQGSVLVGGNGREPGLPAGLSFDRQGNLYVAYYGIHQVKRFDVKRS